MKIRRSRIFFAVSHEKKEVFRKFCSKISPGDAESSKKHNKKAAARSAAAKNWVFEKAEISRGGFHQISS